MKNLFIYFLLISFTTFSQTVLVDGVEKNVTTIHTINQSVDNTIDSLQKTEKTLYVFGGNVISNFNDSLKMMCFDSSGNEIGTYNFQNQVYTDSMKYNESYYIMAGTLNYGSYQYFKITILDPTTVSLNDIKLYPIPAIDNITIEFDDIYDIKIYSLNGQIVYQNSDIVKKININISNFESGVYVVSNGSKTIKFVKL